MSSKWCPSCGRIVTTSDVPNYCPWGCGSLENEPLLPPVREWTGNYYEMVEKARSEWQKRQEKIKAPTPEYIGNGRLQMRLF